MGRMVSFPDFIEKIKVNRLKRSIESGKLNGYALPKHVAFIPDGNRRYATKHHSPPLQGHLAGYDKAKELLNWALDIGIQTLSLYAFSTENFKRSPEEITHLMELLLKASLEISKDEKIHRNKVRIRFIGNRNLLPPALIREINTVEEGTRQYSNFALNIAIGYGGRDEILRAVQRIGLKVLEGSLAPDSISETTIQQFLDTGMQQDPDLIIRTSGEQRISGFLSWQGTYSELCFQQTLFPAYQQHHFLTAIHQFQMRNRRYGK